MATLNVKNLPDRIYRKLRLQAKSEHRSVAQQVTVILEAAVESPQAHSLLELRGLGAERWKGIAAEAHVEEERRGWS